MASDTVRSLDRISMLPDSVLCHILSFLPTKNAVGTSILSTRYQYLWTCITSLHFDKAEFFTNDIGEAEADLSFTNFSWISTATKRNVQKLELQYFDFNREIPIQLPRTLFVSKTLVDLKLDGMISPENTCFGLASQS
ncbi:FBD-associated F-box protein At4g10400-like [Rhododendron vialii]|uniref:FBD-associated F-box protein At4g10400-like n=1 Tax=Rhododendron vialii TaxID=182163 RepID=UPI00265D67B5|nr:FBD-associated F-box protein At4g10400-like [Rhododendron vialii]